jgi:hypothetical protein
MKLNFEIYKDGGFDARIGRLMIHASTRHSKDPRSLYPFGCFIVFWEQGDYMYALIDMGYVIFPAPTDY